jgi:hypothetical protein
LAIVKKFETGGVLLAHSWDGDSDPTGWYGSEKFDGVRAYWNGQDFVSRADNIFFVPEWFKEGMPSEHLDGELWMGRQQYERGCGIVKRHNGDEEWKLIKYHVFDAPNIPGTFRERMVAIPELIKDAPNAIAIKHWVVMNKQQLQTKIDGIVEKGGEGIMIRHPDSLYERKRSKFLLKCKKWFDMEAEVVDITEGKGRNKGILGALICVMSDGDEQFKVGGGFSDGARRWHYGSGLSLSTIKKFWVGKIIKIKYQNKTETRGVPRFASFMSIEEELRATSGQDTPVAVPEVTKMAKKKVEKKVTKKKASKKSKKRKVLDKTDEVANVLAELLLLKREVAEIGIEGKTLKIVTKATKKQVEEAVKEYFPKAVRLDDDPKWKSATGRTWTYEV